MVLHVSTKGRTVKSQVCKAISFLCVANDSIFNLCIMHSLIFWCAHAGFSFILKHSVQYYSEDEVCLIPYRNHSTQPLLSLDPILIEPAEWLLKGI